MKNKFTKFLILCLAITGGSLYAQTARMQIIHNSADAALATVDVYVNNALTLNDFAFRTATPFVDVPADVSLNIGIAPGNSTGSGDIIATFNPTFLNGETHTVVLNGISSLTGYSPATPLSLNVCNFSAETAPAGSTRFTLNQGATDGPTLNVRDVTFMIGNVFIPNLTYGNFFSPQVPAQDRLYQLLDADGKPLYEYAMPFSTLDGQAIAIVASGFVNPANNSNGPAYGLFYATTAGGPLIPLTQAPISTARLQLIHNSADAAVAAIDIYIYGDLAFDNLAFRTATPFFEVKNNITIEIAPSNSTNSGDAVYEKTLTLGGGGSSYAILSGITNPAGGYTPYVPFDIVTLNDALETGTAPLSVDIRAFHGATDAPDTVDIVKLTLGVENLIDNLAYGTGSGTLTIPLEDLLIQVRSADATDVLAEYSAPLQTLGLGGQAMLVLASGFVNPAANNNGPAFGLYVALPAGGALIPLPSMPISTARVQIIHNAADPGTAQVDIVINGNTLLDNFAFRSATPFLDVKVATYNIEVKTANGTTSLTSLAFTPIGGEKYIVVAEGVAGFGFETNADPDADNNTIRLLTKAGAKEKSVSVNSFDFLGMHGASDAPKIDLVAPGVTTLLDNVSYGDIAASYLTIPAAQYMLDVTTADNSNVLASYDVDATTFGGKAGVIFASGFLTPANDNNGPAFSLCYALADGTTGCFSLHVGIDENEPAINSAVYPNPANGMATFEYTLKDNSNLTLRIVDYTGRVVENIYLGNQAAGIYRQAIDLAKYSAGIYTLQLSSSNSTLSKKLVIAN